MLKSLSPLVCVCVACVRAHVHVHTFVCVCVQSHHCKTEHSDIFTCHLEMCRRGQVGRKGLSFLCSSVCLSWFTSVPFCLKGYGNKEELSSPSMSQAYEPRLSHVSQSLIGFNVNIIPPPRKVEVPAGPSSSWLVLALRPPNCGMAPRSRSPWDPGH